MLTFLTGTVLKAATTDEDFSSEKCASTAAEIKPQLKKPLKKLKKPVKVWSPKSGAPGLYSSCAQTQLQHQ